MLCCPTTTPALNTVKFNVQSCGVDLPNADQW
jgi:hypothetical protein